MNKRRTRIISINLNEKKEYRTHYFLYLVALNLFANMFSYGGYYYIIVILQAYCAVHSYRRGTLNKWIFLIIFLPVIGSIIYIYSEILSNRRFRKPNIDVGAVLNPGGKIKKLEEELNFTDTFANKIKLADAYLAARYTDKAIDLYKASLTGAFAENEHVRQQLVQAYFEQQRYDEVIDLAKNCISCLNLHVQKPICYTRWR